jgi:hypothetical protein
LRPLERSFALRTSHDALRARRHRAAAGPSRCLSCPGDRGQEGAARSECLRSARCARRRRAARHAALRGLSSSGALEPTSSRDTRYGLSCGSRTASRAANRAENGRKSRQRCERPNAPSGKPPGASS